MAAFKDPPLKQVIDDLMIQNPETVPGILKPENCELLALAPVASDGFTNTRATLRINTAADGYPTGDLTVRMRRLDLATLFNTAALGVVFNGVKDQSVSLEDILKKLDASITAYILPELVDNGPYAIGRTSANITITPKPGSLVVSPTPLVLGVGTAPVDISTFLVADGINPYTEQMPFPSASATLDDVKKLIVERIFLINGHSAAFALSDLTLTPLDDNWENPGLGAKKVIRVSFTNSDGYYTGTKDFRYNLADLTARMYEGESSGGYPFLEVAEGQTLAQTVVAKLQSKDKYGKIEDLYDLSPRAVRQVDFNTFTETSSIYGADDSWVYAGKFYGFDIRAVNTYMYPFEEIIRFVVDVESTKRIFAQTSNLSTMPVTVELLEKPAAFAPDQIPLDANLLTTVPLPVGTYKIRITRPDSYRTAATHRLSSPGTSQDLRITEVFKAKGHDLSSLFAFQDQLVTVHPGAFDQSEYTNKAAGLFQWCTSLATLPDGIFDKMRRCIDWSFALANTDALRVVPNELFAMVNVRNVTFASLFRGAGPDNLPGTILKNARYIKLLDIFNSASKIKTIGAGLIKNMALRVDTVSVWGMFYNCSSLQSIPPNLFEGLVAPTFKTTPSPYTATWSFNQVFFGCSSLTTVPTGLFDPVIALWDQGTFNMQDMFSGCTGLTSLPGGMFSGVKFPTSYASLAGCFYGCTGLTSIPATLFQGCKLYGAIGAPDNSVSRGTFHSSGLTSIPANLFQDQGDTLSGAKFTFSYTNITAIPAGLFANCPLLADLQSCFAGCQLLEAIPATLFQGCPNLLRMESTFNRTPLVTTIPSGLFDPLTKLTYVGYAFWESGVTNIPAGLFANCVALVTAEGVFYASKIAGVLDNIFTNQPALTNVDSAFVGTRITSAGANVLSGAPNITQGRGLFTSCDLLTSIHEDFFKYNTKITSTSGMFFGCSTLPSVPANLLKTMTALEDVNTMFYGCKLFTTFPTGFLSTQVGKIKNVSSFAQNCSGLTSIPSDLFSNQPLVTSASSAFNGCESLTAIPNSLFSSFAACVYFDNVFTGCKALTSIGSTLFPNSELSVDLTGIFDGCIALAVVPDQIFFSLKNIKTLRFAFRNCYGLTNVGRLVQNTKSVKIEIGGLLAGDQTGTGPTPYPDLTIADNLIDSTIACEIGAYAFTLPFNRRNLLTKNIDNLFGANLRINIASFETKTWFADMKITGNGTNFITKHQVATTNTGFFRNSTTLSDYATLPAWAKS